jgi:hypothetical protein
MEGSHIISLFVFYLYHNPSPTLVLSSPTPHACARARAHTHPTITKGTMTPQVHTKFLAENFTETAPETRHRWYNKKLILYKQMSL